MMSEVDAAFEGLKQAHIRRAEVRHKYLHTPWDSSEARVAAWEYTQAGEVVTAMKDKLEDALYRAYY